MYMHVMCVYVRRLLQNVFIHIAHTQGVLYDKFHNEKRVKFVKNGWCIYLVSLQQNDFIMKKGVFRVSKSAGMCYMGFHRF